jgi:protocatechuate 3,4-dioxygenase beta subunit
MKGKSLKLLPVFFLTLLLLTGLSLIYIIDSSSAQDSSSCKISGFILDYNGHGVANAMIIFNVPDIVPAVYSEPSGYYEIFAPIGNYHINVWPPFDSNLLAFDQASFIAESSDIKKNITLNLGYKLSGYLTDNTGNPIRGALASLDQFHCGWYSNSAGYYFVTAPAGNYSLSIEPKTGPIFHIYNEKNFLLNRNTIKNLILTISENSSIQNSQSSDSFRISGYVLDPQGHGIEDAHIIFNVPEIVSSVKSDSLGYYEVYAPAGTYHINVWPPFDSNFINFDQAKFTVESDTSKNITLTSGYKVSGYISDSSGNPVANAAVLLNEFGSGWFSNNFGYYFVNVPAGLYNLTVKPRFGFDHFSNYFESNFTVYTTITKNITVTDNSTTPSPLPEDQSSNPIEPYTFYDNFDDGDADGWTQQVESWSVKNGEYIVSVGIVENGISTVKGLNLKDCTIETKFRFIDDIGFRAGLVFRYMEKDTYYSLELSNEYDVLCFVKYLPEYAGYGTQDHGFVGTAPTEINFANGELMLGRKVIGSVPTATIDKGVDYTLRVTVTGNIFVGEVISDGFYQRIVWEDIDNPFEYGTVGLRARAAGVSFDYFKISNPILIPKPTLNISCKSSTSYSGFNVEIKGFLVFNETVIANTPIFLSYSVNGGKSWQDLTMIKTASDGTYSVSWNPSVTGIYLIKAMYEGDADYIGSTVEVTLSVIQDSKETVFSVNSNSTISNLTFNSTSRILSFNVIGDSGTTGYADVYIEKSILKNVEEFEVHIDEIKLDYTLSSTESAWLLHFEYSHSAHNITVELLDWKTSDTLKDIPEFSSWTLLSIAIIIAGIITGIYRLKLRKQNAQAM